MGDAFRLITKVAGWIPFPLPFLSYCP